MSSLAEVVNQSPKEYLELLKLFHYKGSTPKVLEIEILPSSISPPPNAFTLADGNCIGIPKSVLVKAFHYATRLFAKQHKDATQLDAVFDSTFVILLFDPEHLTAANFRKRRLLDTACKTTAYLDQQIDAEFVFLDTVLTSPLHRQTKSPTLWFHRWWLLTKLLPQVRQEKDLSARLAKEFSIVLRSGERHRNNYYAFQHARRIMTLVVPSRTYSILPTEAIHIRLVKWCLDHPSDTSGWSFLHFVMINQSSIMLDFEQSIRQVLAFTDQTKWRREALWVFLRSCCTTPGLLSPPLYDSVIERFRSMSLAGIMPIKGFPTC